MDLIRPSWQRGECLITAVFGGGTDVRSGDVKYAYAGAWIFGGSGALAVTTPTLPVRQYDENDLLFKTAEVGDPCTVTVCNGVVKLFVQTEVWAETDCEDA